METPIEGDQAAGTQSDTLISQATTIIEPNGTSANGALLQIASNLEWLVSTLKAAPTPTKPAEITEDSPLSTADLVKILEIALNEIRANQNFAFSVLGFAAIAGSIIQRTHIGGSGTHDDYSLVFWGLATLLLVIAAVLTAISKQYLYPLGTFVKASAPGEAELVLVELRSALHKANTAVRRARLPKILVACGIVVLLFALCCEFRSSIKAAKNSSQDKPKAEQQIKGGE